MNPFRAFILAVLAISVFAGPIAHATLPSPHYRHSRLVAAWLPSWENNDGKGAGWKSVEHNLGLLDQVSFFDAQVDAKTGAITEKFGATSDNINQQVAHLHTAEIQAFATVTLLANVHDVLSNPSALNILSDNIISLVNAHDFDGVDIDFEDFKDKDPADAPIYTQFLSGLADRLHQRKDNFQLPTTVIATILSRTSRGSFHFADETALANSSVDQVRIMAYDQNWPGSKAAGADSPLPWYESVATYLRSVDAPTWKFVIGIPSYGDSWPVNSTTDWKTTARGTTITYVKAQTMITALNIKPQWSSTDDAPYLSFSDPKTNKPTIAFYEDAQSWQAKLTNVIASGGSDDMDHPKLTAFGGMAEWALGYEDPAGWNAVNDSLTPLAPVYSAIGNCYTHFGAGGRFGVALSSEEDAGPYSEKAWNSHIGRQQQFEGGTFYYEWGQPRAFFVTGSVLDQYRKQGGPAGPYGFPIGDPIIDSNGSETQEFEHGSLIDEIVKQVKNVTGNDIEAAATLAESATLAVGGYAVLKMKTGNTARR